VPIHRPISSVSGSPLGQGAPDAGEWGVLFPNLVEFLCSESWAPDEPRTTGTIMLFREAGTWKCWVHDRDAARGAFVTGRSPEDVLRAVDEGLGTDYLDWRPDRRRSR
jgi:hypothetical protein